MSPRRRCCNEGCTGAQAQHRHCRAVHLSLNRPFRCVKLAELSLVLKSRDLQFLQIAHQVFQETFATTVITETQPHSASSENAVESSTSAEFPADPEHVRTSHSLKSDQSGSRTARAYRAHQVCRVATSSPRCHNKL